MPCTQGSAWFCLTSAYCCYGAADDDDRRELSELRQELPDGNHVPNLVVAAQLGRIVGYQACLPRQGVRTLQVQKQAEILQLHVEMLLLRRSPKAPKLAAGPSCDRSRHIHTIRASNLVPSQLHLYMLNAQWSTESARLFASLTESLCWGGSFQPDRSWWLEVARGGRGGKT